MIANRAKLGPRLVGSAPLMHLNRSVVFNDQSLSVGCAGGLERIGTWKILCIQISYCRSTGNIGNG